MTEYIKDIKILVVGETGMAVDFGSKISLEINVLVQQVAQILTNEGINGIIEIVPTYRSVMIYFDPIIIERCELAIHVQKTLDNIENNYKKVVVSRVIHIPVCYGGVFGPDMDFVVRYTGLSMEQVINLHTSKPYFIYMLGFTPGFPYLGGLHNKLIVPRLRKARNKIPAGTVGIADKQTGFYTVESTGEWRIIGRTPVKAFDPKAANPFLFAAGDYLQFTAISVDDFFEICGKIDEGQYCPKITSL